MTDDENKKIMEETYEAIAALHREESRWCAHMALNNYPSDRFALSKERSEAFERLMRYIARKDFILKKEV